MSVDDHVLLERETETASITAALAEAVAGRGSLTLVCGPAGIGKTALLLQARTAAEGDGLRVLAASGAALEAGFPYGAVRQLLEGAVSAATAEERDRLLAAGARPAERVLGAPVPDVPAAPGQDASFGVLHGLYWLVANLAADAPLMLCIDDVHWCDRPSLRFLVHLARRVDELPVAVVAGLRTGEPGVPEDLLAELLEITGTRTVTPQALSQEAVDALVRRDVLAEADARLSAACHRATAGNPLYLRQLLRALAEIDRPSPELAEELHPEPLGRYVLDRLRRLGEVGERLAIVMALLGRGPLNHAARLAELQPAEAEDAANALVAVEILRSIDPFEFVHPVVRSVIEAELPARERDGLHLAAAEVLREEAAPAAEVAAHLHRVRAGAGRAWCVDALREAAREALARGAPQVAVRDLRRALDEPPATGLRARVLGELGVAEEHAGDAAAVDHLREALDAEPAQPQRSEAALRLGVALLALFRFEEGLKVLREAVEELDGAHPEMALVLDARLISAAMAEPRYGYLASDRLDRLDRLVTEAGEHSEARGFLLAARALNAMMDNRRDESLALAHEALGEIAQFRMPPSVQQQAVALIFFPLLAGEDYGTVEPLVAMAGAAAQAGGLTFDLFVSHALRSLVAERLGRLAEAEVHARAALGIVGAHDIVGASGWGAAALVEALVQKGDLDEADAAAALIPDEVIDSVEGRHYLLPARGRLRHAQRRHEEALADFLKTGDVLEPPLRGAFQVRVIGSAHWRSSAALVLDEMGRPDEARELASEELERAREFGAPRALAFSLRALGLVTRGAAGVELLEEAVAVVTDSPAQLEQARANVAYGALLRRENRRADAREPLRLGLDIAARCGAKPLADYARAELIAAGGRPRRERTTGTDALTSAELRVAQLAAAGTSNREIAQQLFLSLKTVEMHLNRTYRKLGIESRRDLDAALSGAE